MNNEEEKILKLLRDVQKFRFTIDENNNINIDIFRTVDVDPKSPSVFVDRVVVPNSIQIIEILSSQEFRPKQFQPRLRGIFLVDVVGYSKFDTMCQAGILSFFAEAIKSSTFAVNLFSPENNIEQIIPTGDGCYIVFSESVNDRFFRMALSLRANFFTLQNRILSKRKKPKIPVNIEIRIACCLGEVDLFIDSAGRQNCYGIGMNEAQRILTCGQNAISRSRYSIFERTVKFINSILKKKMFQNKFQNLFSELKSPDETIGSVFFDKSVHSQAVDIQSYLSRIGHKSEITDLGNQKDKHNMFRRVYCMKGLPTSIAYSFHSIHENPKFPQPVFIRK